jgi:hypothetical protein
MRLLVVVLVIGVFPVLALAPAPGHILGLVFVLVPALLL